MGRLRPQRDEVPEHVGVLEVRLRVPLLGVDEAGSVKTHENTRTHTHGRRRKTTAYVQK